MTKYLIAFILIIATATFALAMDKHPCEENKCYAAWGFGFNDAFRFGRSTTVSTPDGDTMAYSDGDVMVYSDGDTMAY